MTVPGQIRCPYIYALQKSMKLFPGDILPVPGGVVPYQLTVVDNIQVAFGFWEAKNNF